MKNDLTHILTLCLGLVLLALPLGCASTGGGGYRLKQTQMDIDWKMAAYAQAVTAIAVTVGQQQAVQSAHAAYQAAFQQALTEANGNLDAPSPPYVLQKANQLISVLSGI